MATVPLATAHHGDGTWGRSFYAMVDGTSWVLLQIAEVGASGAAYNPRFRCAPSRTWR